MAARQAAGGQHRSLRALGQRQGALDGGGEAVPVVVDDVTEAELRGAWSELEEMMR